MRSHRRKLWPPFALVGACIYAPAGERVHEGVGGIGGPFGSM
jgi:hypothetical protein